MAATLGVTGAQHPQRKAGLWVRAYGGGAAYGAQATRAATAEAVPVQAPAVSGKVRIR